MQSPERQNTRETPFTCVSIVDFEQVIVSWDMFKVQKQSLGSSGVNPLVAPVH